MRKPLRVILIGVAILALGACVFGPNVDYGAQMVLNLPNGSQSVALAVLDHRPYVLSSDKGPSFVGLQRTAVGIPYDVNTKSGRPLAESFSRSLAQSLAAKGYKVEELNLAHTVSTDDAIKRAVGTGADRSVILEFTEWKSDQLQNIAMYYAVSLAVYDKQFTMLAQNSLSGRDNIDSNAFEGADEIAPARFRQKMTQLFGKPEVQTAFAAGP